MVLYFLLFIPPTVLSSMQKIFPTSSNSSWGLVITGGSGAEKSVEVWSPDNGQNCSGPDLPDERVAHSADLTPAGIVVCGRWNRNTQSSCIVWAPGTSNWTLHATIQSRYDHVSFLLSPSQLILIGGATGNRSSNFSSTEIVGVGSDFTLLRPDRRRACLIILENSTVLLTGGFRNGDLNNVDQYDAKMFIKSFPSLQQARSAHACGSLSGTLIVAGGGLWFSNNRLDTTELLRPGASAWQFAAALPHKVSVLRGVNIRDSFYVTGGSDDSGARNEILRYNLTSDTWNKVGTMENARSFHAVAVVDDVAAFCGTGNSARIAASLDLIFVVLCIFLVLS